MAQNHRWLWIGVAVLGIVWALLNVLALALLIALPLIPQLGMPRAETVVFLGVVLVSLWLSLLLLAATWRALRRQPAYTLFPHWGWLPALILLTLALLSVGALAHATLAGTIVFAFIQAGAIVLPALGILLLVIWLTGNLAAPTLREAALTLSGGALSTLIAMPVEIIGLVASIVLVMIAAMLYPGGEAEIARLMAELENWSAMPAGALTIEMLLPWFSSPVVLSVLALTIAVVTPIIEEIGKTLVLVVMSWHKRPSPALGFLWGVLCGLGFAMVEGVGNGSMGIGEAVPWLSSVGSRILATTMHALASGLIGLGWSLFWQRRYWALPLSYLAAILFHGLWNFSIVLMLGGAGPMLIGGEPTVGGALVMVSGLGILGLLALLAPVLLLGTPLLLRRTAPKVTPVAPEA